MLDKLPELFGRNFITGFFVPALFFVLTFCLLLNAFNLLPSAFQASFTTQAEVIALITTLGLISLLTGILLLTVNKEIIRFFEGYGKFNPLKIFLAIEKRNFTQTTNKLRELDKSYISYSKQGKEVPTSLKQKRNIVLIQLATRFPDDERWLLPTSFGNTIRAFEVYPRIMYGVDSIPCWERLIAAIPDNYLKYIDEAKAKVDLWLNFLGVNLLLLCGYLALLIYVGKPSVIWLPLLNIALSYIAYMNSQSSAVDWGKFVKASFDLFLPDLCRKLQFDTTKITNVEQEKEMWRKFSQAIIYVNPKSLPERYSQQETEE